MIFSATHAQVLRGAKTTTRRVMVPYPTSLPPRRPPGVGHHPAPAKWPARARAFDQDWRALNLSVGDVRAVQPGRGMEAVGYIEITRVEPALLGAVTDEDAVREGFKDRAAFMHAWVGIHDRVWARQTGRLLDRLPALPDELDALAGALELTPRALARRLRDLEAAHVVTTRESDDAVVPVDGARRVAREHRFQRHSGRAVWVIDFELVRAPSFTLASRPPRARAKPDESGGESPEDRGYRVLAPTGDGPVLARSLTQQEVDDLNDEAVAPGEVDAMTKDARGVEALRERWERTRDLDDLDALIARVESRGLEGERTLLQKLLSARRVLVRRAA